MRDAGSPFDWLTNCARPIVPPAPGTLVTCTEEAIFSSWRAFCMVRAVWSQPPPGAAGAMILYSAVWALDSPGPTPSAPAARRATAIILMRFLPQDFHRAVQQARRRSSSHEEDRAYRPAGE